MITPTLAALPGVGTLRNALCAVCRILRMDRENCEEECELRSRVGARAEQDGRVSWPNEGQLNCKRLRSTFGPAAVAWWQSNSMSTVSSVRISDGMLSASGRDGEIFFSLLDIALGTRHILTPPGASLVISRTSVRRYGRCHHTMIT